MALELALTGAQYSQMATKQVVISPLVAGHSSGQSPWQRGSAPSPNCCRLPGRTSITSQGTKDQHEYNRKRCTPMCAIFNNSGSKQAAATSTATSSSTGSEQVANAPSPPDLARRWREIQGSNDWQGLLDPLDRTLREEILRYGEFTQATYDSFDFDDHSKYCGSARYNKAKMFEKVGLFNTGYEITKYFYATANVDLPFFFKKPENDAESWSKDSNWMGYVAVCTDEEKVKQLGRRDIVIAWRGTIRNSEWAANFQRGLAPAAMDKRPNAGSALGKVRVETGFLALYTSKNAKTRYNRTSARTQVLTELKRLLGKYRGEQLSITITGHSLGSALATLNAYDIAQLGLNQPSRHAPVPTGDWNKAAAAVVPANPKDRDTIPVTVFSFAGPRVGNDAFRDRVGELGVKVLRMVNVNDFVPRVPGLLVNEKATFLEKLVDQFPFTYIHVGTELKLNNLDSEFLDPSRASKGNVHNLEQYLHLVDGHQGHGRQFQLTTGRQIALVNKSCNFLKKQRLVPECWWQQENKGLVMTPQRLWVQPDRELEDIPTADEDFS